MQPHHISASPVTPPAAELPPPQAVDHIVRTYHVTLRADLLQTRNLFGQALAPAPSAQRALLEEMDSIFSALSEELYAHMDKEEKVLFPWIRAGRGASARAPIKVMQHEHQQTRELLARLRTLSERSLAEGAADPLAQSIAARLVAIESALLEHMDVEESLFRRVLSP